MNKKEFEDRFNKLFNSVLEFERDDEGLLVVKAAGKEVWHDMRQECPEDLIWSRDIGDLAFEFFKVGYECAQHDFSLLSLKKEDEENS